MFKPFTRWRHCGTVALRGPWDTSVAKVGPGVKAMVRKFGHVAASLESREFVVI